MDVAPSERALRPPSATLSFVLIAVLCLIWGSTWLVIKKSLLDLPPLTSAAVRLVFAALAMAVLAPWLHRYEGGRRPPLWMWLGFGLTQSGASFGIIYYCERVLPSGLSAVLWSVYPLLIALFGHLLLPQERLHGRQWLGFGAGFLGVAAIFASDLTRFGADAVPMALLLFLSPLMVAFMTILVKKHGAGVSSLLLNRNGLCVGAVGLSLVAWLTERDQPALWSGRALFAVGYLATVGTVVAFGLYFWLMRSVAAFRLSLIAYVTPAVALVLGWLAGEESIEVNSVLGLAGILVGVVLATRRH
ncbi:MAG: EamA family transporter [Planctomycetes bacterium]|nr:EamA family transporter [Planctomycetota bacterium]